VKQKINVSRPAQQGAQSVEELIFEMDGSEAFDQDKWVSD